MTRDEFYVFKSSLSWEDGVTLECILSGYIQGLVDLDTLEQTYTVVKNDMLNFIKFKESQKKGN